MLPDTPTATCHINHIIATGAGFHPDGDVAQTRDGTIETDAVPGQMLMSHAPFVQQHPGMKNRG